MSTGCAIRHIVLGASVVSALALAIFTAAAAEVDFYAGKNIQLLIGFSGGGYKAYARLLAPISADIINVTLQIGLSRDKSLPHLPLIMELTQDARSKAALKVIVVRQSMARPFAAPPGRVGNADPAPSSLIYARRGILLSRRNRQFRDKCACVSS